jgi:large subunit ribosomal protein L33
MTSFSPILDFRPLAATFRPTHREPDEDLPMAKAASIKIKLVSSADTGFYYVTKKNSRTMTDKLTKKKYDPVAKKHVEFRESKIK